METLDGNPPSVGAPERPLPGFVIWLIIPPAAVYLSYHMMAFHQHEKGKLAERLLVDIKVSVPKPQALIANLTLQKPLCTRLIQGGSRDIPELVAALDETAATMVGNRNTPGRGASL